MNANIETTSKLIRQAAADGADFITTPEVTHLMVLKTKELFSKIHFQADDPGLKAFQALAAKLGKWLLIGSLAIRISEDKVANRSFLIGPDGSIASYYDKVHMFDVDLPSGESYRESATYQAGEKTVLAKMPWGMLGQTVCYDLRFPYLFRVLAQKGAAFITVPAAFTQQTGQAHWHVLLRARAIETGCFIIAPAQTGDHECGRKTYGHSLIINPWGEILADGGTGSGTESGVVTADIDRSEVKAARAQIPSLCADRPLT